MKKVYSIWICFDVPKHFSNKITKFSINKEDIVGTTSIDKSVYDKLTIMMLFLNDKDTSRNELLESLNILFSSELSISKKKELLKEHGCRKGVGYNVKNYWTQ